MFMGWGWPKGTMKSEVTTHTKVDWNPCEFWKNLKFGTLDISRNRPILVYEHCLIVSTKGVARTWFRGGTHFGGGGGGGPDPLFFASGPKSQGSPLMYFWLPPNFGGGGAGPPAPPPWLRPCS